MNKLLYDSPNIKTPYVNNLKIIFADDTASGRPCKLIDEQIQQNILPYYSNTHSNAYCGMKMSQLVEEVRDRIHKLYNLTDKHIILFTGNGATGAINHLVNSIDYKKYKHVYVYISIYEHYSNHLPWIEIAKIHNNIKVIVIREFNSLENELQKTVSCDDLNIVSITGCSNVSGKITNLQEIQNIISRVKKPESHVFLLVDCACLAPHKIFDCQNIDAVFISMHKFLGGTSTPGLLIAKNILFEKASPYNPGGGCVRKIEHNKITYEHDIEKRETGGTPNIVGILRIKYILDIFEQNYKYMIEREEVINKIVNSRLTELANKYKNFILLFLNIENKVPIVSFVIKNLHYNLVIVLLNDLFGIQSRGGISCCGLLGDDLEQHQKISGWCRITFSWLMPDSDVEYILKAIEFIARFGKTFSKDYNYDRTNNMFIHNGKRLYNLPSGKLFEVLKN